jgi:hypothetical protein
MIGTNVYDFSFAGGSACAYSVRGTITRIYPKSVEIISAAGTVFVPAMGNIRGSVSYDGPSGQLQALAALKMGEKPLSPGAFYSLSPEMRSYFMEVQTYRTNYVLNLTDIVLAQKATIGDRIQTLAIPTATHGFWDHGTTVTNISAARILRVFPDRMVWVNVTNSISSAHNPIKP